MHHAQNNSQTGQTHEDQNQQTPPVTQNQLMLQARQRNMTATLALQQN